MLWWNKKQKSFSSQRLSHFSSSYGVEDDGWMWKPEGVFIKFIWSPIKKTNGFVRVMGRVLVWEGVWNPGKSIWFKRFTVELGVKHVILSQISGKTASRDNQMLWGLVDHAGCHPFVWYFPFDQTAKRNNEKIGRKEVALKAVQELNHMGICHNL